MQKEFAAKTTRGGLSPELYQDLQDIPVNREFDYPMSAKAREDLKTKLQGVKSRIHRTERSIEFQQQIIDRIGTFSTFYDRASFVRENLNHHITILRQLETKLEHDLAQDDLILSERLAYDLQMSEIASHRQLFGRLDWPGNPDRPGPAPPKGLQQRSVNVPTPRRWYQPSTSAAAHQQVSEPVPIERRVPALRSPETPSELDQAKLFTPIVKFRKCAHKRLHRLVSPADFASMKLLLKKSCENICGKNSSHICTLNNSLPKKGKPVKMSSLEDSSPMLEEVVEVPAAQVPVVVNLDDSNVSNEEPLVRVDKKPTNSENLPDVITQGDPEWPIQVDGLNVDEILNLSTEPEDNGREIISSSFSQNLPFPDNQSENGTPNRNSDCVSSARSFDYRDFASPRFVTPPDVWGRATPCSCRNNFRLGYCFCPDKMDSTTEWISMGCSPFHSSLFESSINDDHDSNVPDSDEDAHEPNGS